jgi:UDP-glucose 4-epimerase
LAQTNDSVSSYEGGSSSASVTSGSQGEKGCILVTGGAGFIGSHTCVELLENAYDVVVIDDLSNSSEVALKRVEKIAGRKLRAFYQGDACDPVLLDRIFDEQPITGVIHFAAFKAVGESVHKPIEYYQNNLGSTLNVARAMRDHGVHDFVFSSSATVYGEPDSVPCTEDTPLKPATSPYGWTKSMNEQMLRDLVAADPAWNVMLLRYFNPIGAHPSGLIGEDPKGIPNNLVPYVAKVAIGELDFVRVFGNDYPTPDGTGVRDYIHVVDLARGHVSALDYMRGKSGVHVFNLGTGKGSSVLEVIAAFSRACGRDLPYKILPRRAGDIAENYADPSKAERLMGWKALYDLDKMCEDSWHWQQMNPNGYAGAAE